MYCEHCIGLGVRLVNDDVCECRDCCGTGISPQAEVSRMQAVMVELAAELGMLCQPQSRLLLYPQS